MAVHGRDFEKGRRLKFEDLSTIEPGTFLFYKGFLVKVRGRMLQLVKVLKSTCCS